jgi:hypothetical protein
MRLLKQSTAVSVPIGPAVDADGAALPSLTISQADVRLKKNGANWGQKNESSASAHEENGFYECALDTTDTNTLGHLRLAVAESGALVFWEDFLVVPADVYDAFVSGTGDGIRANAQVAAAAVLTAIWSNGTRELTSGANIVLAKGTGITGLNDLSGANILAALGLASGNLDTQLGAIAANVVSVLARIVDKIVTSGSVVADGGNTATTFKTNLTQATNEHWKECFILLTSGTLDGALRKIDGYNGSTKFVTVSPAFPATPGNAVTFTIINR